MTLSTSLTVGYSLLLANFTQSGKVLPLLHTPFGTVQTSAVTDVKAQGYLVPPNATMLDPIVKSLIDPAISDGILALTALYNTCSKPSSTSSSESLPHTHTGRRHCQTHSSQVGQPGRRHHHHHLHIVQHRCQACRNDC